MCDSGKLHSPATAFALTNVYIFSQRQPQKSLILGHSRYSWKDTEYTTRVCGEENVSYGGNQDRSHNSVRIRSPIFEWQDIEVYVNLIQVNPFMPNRIFHHYQMNKSFLIFFNFRVFEK